MFGRRADSNGFRGRDGRDLGGRAYLPERVVIPNGFDDKMENPMAFGFWDGVY